MIRIDLADVPIVDAHLHGFRVADVLARPTGGFLDRVTMMGMCLVSSGRAEDVPPDELTLMTATTPFALRLARELAARLGCDSEPEALGVARRDALAADPDGYLRGLWRDANVVGCLCDDGYPQPPVSTAEMRADSRLEVHRVARIEPVIAAATATSTSYDDLEDALSVALDRFVAEGAIAFKSVIAYRTGLDVGDPTLDDARSAFRRWRDARFAESREHAKPVRDRLLRLTFAAARRHAVPVHIHCGGGDPDVVLPHVRPAGLFDLLREHFAQPVVLIHSGQPWLDEGAHLAQILPGVHLELSVNMPWASLALDRQLETLLGIAPGSKVLYGSDESTEPEVIWASARVGRAVVERVLGRGVEHDWLSPADARRIGEGVLAGNARRLHGV